MLGAVARNEYLAGEHPQDLVKRAVFDIDDAVMVLSGGGLYPKAVGHLENARKLTEEAADDPPSRPQLAKKAIKKMNRAKGLIIE
jgi:hypothetical protein